MCTKTYEFGTGVQGHVLTVPIRSNMAWVLNEKTGFMEQVLTARELLERRVVSWLNDNQLQGSNSYFNTGLGTLHIYWDRHGWECRWIEIEPLPDDLPEWPGRYRIEG